MNDSSTPLGRRRIIWPNVLPVISAAILISAEVFGAAFAGGWAVANLFDLGDYGVHIMQGLFFLCGFAVIGAFVGHARQGGAGGAVYPARLTLLAHFRYRSRNRSGPRSLIEPRRSGTCDRSEDFDRR